MRTVQKGRYVEKYEVLTGVAQHKRRHSSFKLNALVVVKMNITVKYFTGLAEWVRFTAIDTLCLEDRKEFFRHSVVVTISSSWHWGYNSIRFCQVKVCLRGVLNPLVAVEVRPSFSLASWPGEWCPAPDSILPTQRILAFSCTNSWHDFFPYLDRILFHPFFPRHTKTP